MLGLILMNLSRQILKWNGNFDQTWWNRDFEQNQFFDKNVQKQGKMIKFRINLVLFWCVLSRRIRKWHRNPAQTCWNRVIEQNQFSNKNVQKQCKMNKNCLNSVCIWCVLSKRIRKWHGISAQTCWNRVIEQNQIFEKKNVKKQGKKRKIQPNLVWFKCISSRWLRKLNWNSAQVRWTWDIEEKRFLTNIAKNWVKKRKFN